MGAMQLGGRSEMVVLDGILNRDSMLLWAAGLFGQNFVYVQDNAATPTQHVSQLSEKVQISTPLSQFGHPHIY